MVAGQKRGSPANVVSKRNYRGINPLILRVASMRHGFRRKWWATCNQWKGLGGSVMRRPDDVPPGKWGTTIVFWSRSRRPIGRRRRRKLLLPQVYTVFCVDQVDGDHLDHLRVGNCPLDAQEVQERYETADEPSTPPEPNSAWRKSSLLQPCWGRHPPAPPAPIQPGNITKR